MESWVNESWTQRCPLIRKSSRVFTLLTLQRWRFPGSRPQVWAPACPPPSSCHHPGYSLSGALGKTTVILLSVSVQSRPLTKRRNGQSRNASRRDGKEVMSCGYLCHTVQESNKANDVFPFWVSVHFQIHFWHWSKYSDKSSWWSLLNFFKS